MCLQLTPFLSDPLLRVWLESVYSACVVEIRGSIFGQKLVHGPYVTVKRLQGKIRPGRPLKIPLEEPTPQPQLAESNAGEIFSYIHAIIQCTRAPPQEMLSQIPK